MATSVPVHHSGIIVFETGKEFFGIVKAIFVEFISVEMSFGQVGQETLAQISGACARLDHFIIWLDIELLDDLCDVHLINDLGLVGHSEGKERWGRCQYMHEFTGIGVDFGA